MKRDIFVSPTRQGRQAGARNQEQGERDSTWVHRNASAEIWVMDVTFAKMVDQTS
jgi:hypothetical protein